MIGVKAYRRGILEKLEKAILQGLNE